MTIQYSDAVNNGPCSPLSRVESSPSVRTRKRFTAAPCMSRA